MTTIARPAWLILLLLLGSVIAWSARAQTPQQMEYERQQREQWRQQERIRQEQDEIRRYNQGVEQERQRQEAARNQQRREEEARNRDQQFNQPQDAQQRQQKAQQPGGGQLGDQMEQARQTWLKRPPLAAERNPLLGKWTRPASARANSADPFAQIGAMLQGNGLCELMFGGGGVFEFRADRLMGSDARTREQELDRVEYRGDARRVAVIPKTTYKLIVFDFDGPNRINMAGQNCVLVRVGAR